MLSIYEITCNFSVSTCILMHMYLNDSWASEGFLEAMVVCNLALL